MFEKFLSQNLETFRQRYEGTYGFFKDVDAGTRQLVHLDRITNDRCSFINKEGIGFHIDPDTNKNIGFEFLPPETAWHNTPEGAMLVVRRANRQFRRGVCESNINIYLLEQVLRNKSVDFGNLQAIYDSKVSVRDALMMPSPSKAISKMFAISKDKVYLLNSLIGTYKVKDKDSLAFTLDDPTLWKTEISDALRLVNISSEFN